MAGIWPLIATAAATMSAGIGRIETTIGPQMRPAERFSSCVRRDAEHPIRTQEGLGPVDHPDHLDEGGGQLAVDLRDVLQTVQVCID